MKYEYKGHKIGQFSCVSLPKFDRLLVAEKGWIFIANGAGTRLGVVTCISHEKEKLEYYDIKDLGKALFSIGGFMTPSDQVLFANNPNLRYTESKDI